MQVFDVKLNDINQYGKRYYILFGSDHQTIDELTDELRKNGIVSGVKLITKRDEGALVVMDSMPVAISKTAVYTIQLPNAPVREA